MRVAPLRVPAFRRLATTYTLNELCWSFGTIALAVAVFDRTDSALATTLLFLATTFLPALVAPALTARLDQIPVRRALPALYLCEAALFAAIAALSGGAPLPVLIVLALADGAVAIVGRALTRAAVAAALEPSGTLAEGNKLLNVCFSVAFATGPAIAGLVVAAAGTAASLAVTAGLFALMAVLLAASRSLPAAHGDGDRSWRARLREGVALRPRPPDAPGRPRRARRGPGLPRVRHADRGRPRQAVARRERRRVRPAARRLGRRHRPVVRRPRPRAHELAARAPPGERRRRWAPPT